MNISEKKLTFNRLVGSIREIHDQMAAQAGKAVNISLTLRNWMFDLYYFRFSTVFNVITTR